LTGAIPLNRETLYQGDSHDFNCVQAKPGFRMEPHPYTAGDAFMLVLAGAMDLIVDGQTFTLQPGQLAVIPKGATRGFTAGPEGFTMLAAHLRG
jgi:quercetin dioxygenase-like cupin family protein